MLQASLDHHDLGFQLLSDSAMTAAVEFGLAWRMPNDMFEKYVGFGIDIEGASGQKHHVLPVPAVFLVGTDRVVHFQHVDPNHRVRLDAEVLLAAAKIHMERMSQEQ